VPVHPDVVLVERGLYSSSVIGASETTSVSVEQVRRVVRRSGLGPHEGRALVFIVRNAEELTVQAANALLKTLEEPLPRTHFVLLTSRPSRLLDTVRSRTLAVRFGPLPDSIIARILEKHGLSPKAAALAQGSASLAIELASPENLHKLEDFSQAAFSAIRSDDLVAAVHFAENRPSDRDELTQRLGFFAQDLAGKARGFAETAPVEAGRFAERHEIVLTAIKEVESNAQPALVLEAMIARLRQLGLPLIP
jgi:DNA polymerase-3 subunit delta'